MDNRELIRRFVEFGDDIVNMVPLNEDGSLDIKGINSLHHNEKMKVISQLSESQYLSYCSTLPLNESHPRPIQAKMVNYTMEDLIKRGEGVEAFSFLENLK